MRLQLIRRLAFGAVWLAAFPALAGKSKVALFPVVVIGGGVRNDAAAAMTQAISDELRAADLSVAIIDDTSKPKTARSASAAEQKLADGRRELERMHVPKAIELLESAMAGFSADVAGVQDQARFVDAALLLAEAHYRRGNEASGRRAFEAVVRWAPDTKLDTRKYPPVFVSAFEEVRTTLVNGPRGSVLVTSSPEGARVVFNGKAMGLTPLVVDEVIPGENHVAVRSGDGEAEQRAGATVIVEAQRTVERQLSFSGTGDGVRAGIAANRFDAGLRQKAGTLGKAAAADVVVLLGIAEGERLYTVAGFIGQPKLGRWAPLPVLQVDVDMLSASIEGGKLARDVVAQLKGTRGNVTETIPFIGGKMPVVAAAPSKAATHVAFIAGAPADERRPIAENRAPRVEEARVEARPVRSEETRRPVSADPTFADQGPITRTSHLEADSALAADLAAIDGYNPVVDDAPFNVNSQVKSSSITSKWWFWAAVGVGAAIVGGTTYYLVSRDGGGDTLSVQAAW